MFKLCLVLALAAVAVVAQEQPEGAAEPYSYGYSTDTHGAQEQRDPSGRVTGSYQLVGDDGRERRVEYVADAAGFRAKVVTNEVGTKSESPADVELVASEPSPGQSAQSAQYAQYSQYSQQSAAQAPIPPPQAQFGYTRQVSQQVTQVGAQKAPVPIVQQQQGYRQVSSSSAIKQAAPQQAVYGGYGASTYGAGYGYGYYPGNYASGGYYTYPVGYGPAGYNSQYGATGYGYATGANPAVQYTRTTTQRSGLVNIGNYNNHLPSQYYKDIGISSSSSSSGGAPVVSGYRYVNQPAGGPIGGGVGAGYSAQPISGSSNYLVLQKRAVSSN